MPFSLAPVLDLMKSAVREIRRRLGNTISFGTEAPPTPASAQSPDHFSLGTDKSGRSWVLDLATGQVCQAQQSEQQMPVDNVPLASVELTATRLMQFLREAGYGAEVLGDDRCVVATEIGPVLLHHVREMQVLRFLRTFETPDWENTDQAMQAELVGRMNLLAIVTRFTLDCDDGEISAEYELPTIAGISRAQVLASLRLFVFNTMAQVRGTTGLDVT